MCGFAGWICFNENHFINNDPVKNLSIILNSIKHRGPDGEGKYFWGYDNLKFNPETFKTKSFTYDCRIAFGHRRLSIIDLSDAGFQPIADENEEFFIIFNGELYNYIELREKLENKFNFRTKSDTEVLLAAYMNWGDKMFDKLDGIFSFIILDKKNKKIFGARDHLGVKPFYYYFENGLFLFGSEPKVISSILPERLNLNWQTSSEFLLAGLSDHSEDTFFKEIKQIPVSSFFEISLPNRDFKIKSYWRNPELNYSGNEEYFIDNYNKVVSTVIERQLRSDVKVGSSLSGGIDSGTIVKTINTLLSDKASEYNTLTFSFPGFEDDESEIAKKLSQNLGMNWIKVEPSLSSIKEDLNKMTLNMEEPFSSLSMFAQYKVMESAKENNIKVMLDGQGGDEIYLGYPRLAQRGYIEHLKRLNIFRFIKEWQLLKKNLSISMSRSLLGNIYFNSKKTAIWKANKDFSQYVNQDYLSNYRKDLIDDVFAPKSLIEKQIDELKYYCLPRLLKYADRNSMVFGVELRVPHISQLMMSYYLSIPINLRIKNGWTKYIVRKSMNGKLPDEIIWSNVKRGFDIPQSFWIEKLRTTFDNWIDALPESNPFNLENIKKDLADENKRGSYKLWKVLSLIGTITIKNLKI